MLKVKDLHSVNFYRARTADEKNVQMKEKRIVPLKTYLVLGFSVGIATRKLHP